MQYNRENPDEPELDASAFEEREVITPKRRYKAPATLRDSDGEPAEGIAEAQAAALLHFSPATLGRYRRNGYVNPKLILTDSDPRPFGRAPVVWWNKALTEAIAESTTIEPLFVAKEG